LAIGLADANGGVLEAIAEAKARAGIVDSYYQVVELPERHLGFLDLPDVLLSRAARFLGLTNVGQNAALKTLAAETRMDSPQMRLPYELTIE
jgi:hypothetical protein